jgi:hypothetical protein
MRSDRNLIVRIAHRTNRWTTGSANRLKFLAKGLFPLIRDHERVSLLQESAQQENEKPRTQSLVILS